MNIWIMRTHNGEFPSKILNSSLRQNQRINLGNIEITVISTNGLGFFVTLCNPDLESTALLDFDEDDYEDDDEEKALMSFGTEDSHCDSWVNRSLSLLLIIIDYEWKCFSKEEIVLNVGGRKFTVFRKTLSKFPTTRLGKISR